MTDKITKDQLTFENAAFALPRDVKEKWLDALRSGEYKQCGGVLHNGEGYCCLGVLEMVTLGDVDRLPSAPGAGLGGPLGMPAIASCEKMGVKFLDPTTEYDELFCVDGVLIAVANDEGMPFTDIADLVEKNVEVYDRE